MKLLKGHFYWCMPTLDPDNEQTWMMRLQPARFAGYVEGRETWHCLYLDEDPSDWPMSVFGEITVPRSLVDWLDDDTEVDPLTLVVPTSCKFASKAGASCVHHCGDPACLA